MVKTNQRASVVIELAVVVLILLAVFNGIWAFHTLLDVKRNIHASVFAAFNSQRMELFTTNQGGDVIRWDDSNVGPQLTNDLEAWLNSNLAFGSSLFRNLTDISCKVAICYLDIETSNLSTLGYVLNTSGPDDLCFPNLSSGTHEELMWQEAFDYHRLMTVMGRALNPEEGRYALKGYSAGPPIYPVYFPFAPFFTWACQGDIRVLLWRQNVREANVYVPVR